MSKLSTPEIRISYAWLLERESNAIAASNGWQMLSGEQAVEKVDAYRTEWEKYSDEILSFMIKILGLEFYRKVIDVHIAQYFVPSSEPLIISLMDEPDQFVDTLTHELIHVLLTDNNVVQMNGKDKDFELATNWEKLFGSDHSFTTLVHIPVHAVHKKILVEFFKDETRIQRDIELLKQFKSEDYLKSWDYVENVGYEKIIEQLIADYSEIKQRTTV